MIGKSDDTGEFFNARKIVKNKIRCKKCGDIIESVSVNDFKFCKQRISNSNYFSPQFNPKEIIIKNTKRMYIQIYRTQWNR